MKFPHVLGLAALVLMTSAVASQATPGAAGAPAPPHAPPRPG